MCVLRSENVSGWLLPIISAYLVTGCKLIYVHPNFLKLDVKILMERFRNI